MAMERKSANWVTIPGCVIIAYGAMKFNPELAGIQNENMPLVLNEALLVEFLLGWWFDSRRSSR